MTGLKGLASVERREGGVRVESDGVRLSLRGAEAQVEGDTVRVVLRHAK